DQEGTTVTYLVAVTNVHELQISDEPYTFLNAEKWMHTLGGRHTYDRAFINDIFRVYVVPPRNANVWTCGTFGDWGAYIDPLNNLRSTMHATAMWTSWCLTPY
ncbi:Ig-like domain-containing protein, partial [Pseudomonas sp. SDO52101_S400]